MKLLIISDTKIQKREDCFWGFPSVVLELNVFSQISNKIDWIVVDDTSNKPDTSFLLVPSNVTIHIIPDLSLKGNRSVLTLLSNILRTVILIMSLVTHFDVIHVRGPNPVMLISLLLSRFHKNKVWWFKYANNWIDTSKRPFWRFQKFLMRRSGYSIGTINGTWLNEPNHIKSFENPCLLASELDIASIYIASKSYSKKIDLLFVGRVEHEKGIGYLLEWFNNVFNYDRINKLYIIGDGKDKLFFESYVEKKTSSKLKILFVGSLVREELFEYYKKCHFLILPTYASEGFPKVVAEASAFGCIPVTTPVSSIHQYVKNGFNGYDWSYWKRNFNLIISNPNLNEVALNANRTAHLFTYEHYLNRLKETVFHVHR